MLNMNISNYPESRRRILIFKSPHNTTNVVNYAADNVYLNMFLATFDVWKGNGNHKLSDDNNHCEVWFEMSKEFYDIANTETMRKAFNRFGVRVEFEPSSFNQRKSLTTSID